MSAPRLKVIATLVFACALAGAAACQTPTGPTASAANQPVTLGTLGQSQSGGLSPAELMERGWSCRVTPVGSTACSPPGRGLPVFGAPEDRPPSYLVHVFDTATSEYLGFSRMIRTDLYEGQTCPSTGTAYAYLPHIGYYECFNPGR
jgi:hypothetical protein